MGSFRACCWPVDDLIYNLTLLNLKFLRRTFFSVVNYITVGKKISWWKCNQFPSHCCCCRRRRRCCGWQQQQFGGGSGNGAILKKSRTSSQLTTDRASKGSLTTDRRTDGWTKREKKQHDWLIHRCIVTWPASSSFFFLLLGWNELKVDRTLTNNSPNKGVNV